MVAQRSGAAFTLVEMLVVVAVIALLLAVLLPSLEKAREHARMAKCLGNQRQLLTAVAAYGMEHSRLPAGGNASNNPDPGGLSYIRHWNWYQKPGLGQYFGENLPMNLRIDGPGSPAGPPVNSLIRCPSRPTYTSNEHAAYIGYNDSMSRAYNSRFGNSATSNLHGWWLAPRTSQVVPSPSGFILFQDGRQASFMYIAESAYRSLSPMLTGNSLPHTPDPRHFGGVNHGYLDGSAQNVLDINEAFARRITHVQPW